jgi:hypothetical protein
MAGKLTAHVGRLGTGKSYTAAAQVLKGVKAGRRQVTSFDIAIPREWWSEDYGDGEWGELYNGRKGTTTEVFRPSLVTPFNGWEALLEEEDCDVTIDEAHLYAPSWDSKGLPAPARWYLSHLRKLGIDLTWVSQHEERTAKTLRDLTNEIVVHSVFYFGAMWFVGRHYEPEFVRKKNKHTWTSRQRFHLRVASCYDTLQCSEFTGLSEPVDVALVKELADRRNAGVPLRGAAQAVRDRMICRELESETGTDGTSARSASSSDGKHVPVPLLLRKVL